MKNFSQILTEWVNAKKSHTVGELLNILDERSFAFVFLILMAFPALPLPTGGVVHALEVIVIILASQMLLGRQELWLPKGLQKKQLPKPILKKMLPFLIKYIQLFEKISRARGSSFIPQRWFRIQLAFFIIIFTLFAFFAPPLSGVVSFPSLGVVIISIGIILRDVLVVLIGYIIGIIGCGLVVLLGAGVLAAIQQALSSIMVY